MKNSDKLSEFMEEISRLGYMYEHGYDSEDDGHCEDDDDFEPCTGTSYAIQTLLDERENLCDEIRSIDIALSILREESERND